MVAIRDTSSPHGVTLASRVRVLGDDVDLGDELGEFVLDVLVCQQRLAERVTLAEVLDRPVDRLTHGTAPMYAAINRSSWNWDICCWNPRPISPTVFDTGTRTSSKTSSPVSEGVIPIFLIATDRESGRVGRNDDLTHPHVPALVAGAREQANPVGLCSAGDPHLGPVDHPIVAVANSAGLDKPHRIRHLAR